LFIGARQLKFVSKTDPFFNRSNHLFSTIKIMKNSILAFALLFIVSSCMSTKSTIKNIDNNAPAIHLKNSNTFLITEYSTDKKYGYDKDYPINVFYSNSLKDDINQERFLNALAGPNGEEITYTKLESCCPFPTQRSEMGAGFIDAYEIRWKGQSKSIILYLNMYEKGVLMVPVGLSLKKK
jgi:hypothetical protein